MPMVTDAPTSPSSSTASAPAKSKPITTVVGVSCAAAKLPSSTSLKVVASSSCNLLTSSCSTSTTSATVAGASLSNAFKSLPAGNTYKIGFPGEDGSINISSVYKPAMQNSNIILSSPHDIKSFKAVANQKLFNVLCHGRTISQASANPSSKNGRITIGSVQQVSSTSSTAVPSADPAPTGKVVANLVTSANETSDTPPQTRYVTASAAGPIRNYKATIAKQPYPTASTLKIIKSEPVEKSSLGNDVSYDVLRTQHDRSNSGTKQLCQTAYKVLKKEVTAGPLNSTSNCTVKQEMDQVISGGIDTSFMKTEMLEPLDDLIDYSSIIDVKQEPIDRFTAAADQAEIDRVLSCAENGPSMMSLIEPDLVKCTADSYGCSDSSVGLASTEDMDMFFNLPSGCNSTTIQQGFPDIPYLSGSTSDFHDLDLSFAAIVE